MTRLRLWACLVVGVVLLAAVCAAIVVTPHREAYENEGDQSSYVTIQDGVFHDTANYPCNLVTNESPRKHSISECTHAVHQRPLHWFDRHRLVFGTRDSNPLGAPTIRAGGKGGLQIGDTTSNKRRSVHIVQRPQQDVTHQFDADGHYHLHDPTRSASGRADVAPVASKGVHLHGGEMRIGATTYRATDDGLHVIPPARRNGLILTSPSSASPSRIQLTTAPRSVLTMARADSTASTAADESLDAPRLQQLLDIANGMKPLELQKATVTGTTTVSGTYRASRQHNTSTLRTPKLRIQSPNKNKNSSSSSWSLQFSGNDLSIRKNGGTGSVRLAPNVRMQLENKSVCLRPSECLTETLAKQLHGKAAVALQPYSAQNLSLTPLANGSVTMFPAWAGGKYWFLNTTDAN